jgi:hypothetical protein
MKLLVMLWLLFATCTAHSATNLAIVTKDAACANQPVESSTCAQNYAVPLDTDLVRTSPTYSDGWKGTWKAYKDTDTYEGCYSDVPPGSAVGAGDPCTAWGFLKKASTALRATVAAGSWDLYYGSTIKTRGFASQALCAAGAEALGLKRDYTCRTSSKVSVAPSSVGSPIQVLPVVAPPVISPALPTGTVKKWNPGHALLTNGFGFDGDRAKRDATWNRVCADPKLKGGQVRYAWGSIEQTRGQYRFDQIEADLAKLAACGKWLIIEIWYMDYWSKSINNNYVPAYQVSAGCVSMQNQPGVVVMLDRANCMDGFIDLHAALAKRYDSHPNVELIVVTETSATWGSKNSDAFSTQTKRLLRAMAQQWIKTGIVIYANWYPYSRDLFETTLVPLGIGIGGPDIKPNPNDQDDGSCVLRGYGGRNGCLADKGTTDHRGQVPVAYSYQAACKDGPPSTLIGYALDELRATHLTWTDESFDGNCDLNAYGLNGVMAAIKSRNYATNTAYPTSWK